MSPGSSRNSVRSWPTQKPRPAPVSTTARTAGSPASSSAAPRRLVHRGVEGVQHVGTIERDRQHRPVAARLHLRHPAQPTTGLLASSDARAEVHRRSAERGRGARRVLARGHLRRREARAVGRQPARLAPRPRRAQARRRRQRGRDHARRLPAHLGARRRADRRLRPRLLHRRQRARVRGRRRRPALRPGGAAPRRRTASTRPSSATPNGCASASSWSRSEARSDSAER